jgi:hypothetical protein
MQAGGAGAGVDFCPKAGDSQIRKRHPLAQTDNGQMVKCLQKNAQPVKTAWPATGPIRGIHAE